MDWRREPRTWFAIIATLLLWASAFAGIKAGLASFGPGELALLRFGVASAALGLYALFTRMRLPAWRDIPQIAFAGFLGITVYHLCLNFGEASVSAGAASLIISSGPVFTALLSTFFLGERLSPIGWLGVAVAFSGVAVISFSANSGGLSFDPGALLVLVAAIATAAYFVTSKRPLRHYSALEFTTYAIWAGTIPMLVFLPGLVQQLPHATPQATAAVVYLGIFPGAASYVMWSYALSRMQASVLSAFLYLQPVNAMVIAWIWIAEVPAIATLVGGAIAIIGVILVGTKGAKRAQYRIRTVPPDDAAGLSQAAALLVEYNAWLGDAVCAEKLAEEIQQLRTIFAAPTGSLLIAEDPDGCAVGVIGVRPFGDEGSAAEMKRLFVSPDARGAGLGRRLSEAAVGEARALGYDSLVLTTLPDRMEPALAIYRDLGFRPTAPFYDTSRITDPTLIAYLELDLTS